MLVMHFMHLIFAMLVWTSFARAGRASDWRGRSIYQVMTDRFARNDGSITAPCNTNDRVYCGGTYRGMIDKLDYIQSMGFSAVWISPITYNIQGATGWGAGYHGYWQQDLCSLNLHFGNHADLKALSAALHERGMYFMLDVVINHNAWPGSSHSVAYPQFWPFNKQEYYHAFCPIRDYDNQSEVEDCWLGDDKVQLVDLNTEHPIVSGTYRYWISRVVHEFQIDGLRIDTAKHVKKSFWPGFNDAAGVFCTGEVSSGDLDYTCDYQNYLDSVLNYPLYYKLVEAFKSPSGSMTELASFIEQLKDGPCRDPTVLGTFSENHDLPRSASLNPSVSLAKNVIAFTLLFDGIPIIYQGQEQHLAGAADPENREAIWLTGYDTSPASAPLYSFVTRINQIRNHAILKDERYLDYMTQVLYYDKSLLVMRKGFDGNQVITVLTNKDQKVEEYTVRLAQATGLTPRNQVVDVLSCQVLVTDHQGGLEVQVIADGVPRVLYPLEQLVGSGICGY